MKDVEATLLRIPGVTETQVFAKALVRCEFPMAEETVIGLQEAQDWIEHETGRKVEMTVSAGRPERKLPIRPGGMGPTYDRLTKQKGGDRCQLSRSLIRLTKLWGCSI